MAASGMCGATSAKVDRRSSKEMKPATAEAQGMNSNRVVVWVLAAGGRLTIEVHDAKSLSNTLVWVLETKPLRHNRLELRSGQLCPWVESE